MILALVLGTILAIAAFAYVLAPVVIGVRRQPSMPVVRSPSSHDLSIAALREIEFDRATGKLSDTDYAQLRQRYAGEALAMMRATASNPAAPDDPVEAAIRSYRATHQSCTTCGLRPEPDALYCSNCGSFLPGKCDSCGTAVTANGVRFCTDCGTRLAA